MQQNQGRWLAPDPAGLAAVDLTNPQTWNRYAYVGNNPLSNMDPMGTTVTCSTDANGKFSCYDDDPQSADTGCVYNGRDGSLDCNGSFQGYNCVAVGTEGCIRPPSYVPTVPISNPGTGGSTAQPPPKKVIRIGNFPTLDCDGYRAARSVLPQTTKQGLEFGGFLYKNANGHYSYSNPVSGTPTSIPSLFSSPQALVSGIAGWFHSHPLVPGYTNNMFSGNDLLITRYLKGPGHLATADGTIMKLSIDPKGYPQVSNVNSGACQVP